MSSLPSSPHFQAPAPAPAALAAAMVEEAALSHEHLVVRVGSERFALPLHSVAEAIDDPPLLTAAGMGGAWAGFISWRGRRVPLSCSRAPLGLESGRPCAVALLFDDPSRPLALAVDELGDVRSFPPGAQHPFRAPGDEHGVVSAVAWDGDTPVAVLRPAALRAAMLAGLTERDLADADRGQGA